MMYDEQQPLLDPESYDNSKPTSRRERIAIHLESPVFHKTVLTLIALDAAFVLTDLIYTFLTPGCPPIGPGGPLWLEILSHFSLAITTFFLLEIPLSIWAFGFRYYNPFGDNPHASLHIFDAVIIIMTFVLEFVLKGKEKEVAGLLVVLRLWRLVKLVGGIAIGAGHIGEEEAKQLAEAQEELERLRQELISTKEENSRLQSQLDALRG